jgi:NarL family two-component system sensor histidine kinase YdfH
MRTESTLLQKIRGVFFPTDQQSREGDKEVVPFFILITVALIWMYSVYIRQIEQVLIGVIFTVLMIVHLSLYWSIFKFIYSNRNLRLYFSLQGILAFTLVLLAGDFGLSIGLFSSLIGNAVGALRKNKDIVYVIFVYLVLAAISISIVAGYEVILEWSVVAIPSIFFSGIIAFMFRRQLEIRERTQKLLEELQEAHAQLAVYAEKVEELTLATERQRMARELHDTLAQGLTGLVLQLEAVSTHIEDQNNPRAQEILQTAMTQSRTTLAEARKVIDNLRTSDSDGQTFIEKVHQEAQKLEEIAGIPCETSIKFTNTLAADEQTHLLKIISEGLNNIAKHARAKHAWLRLTENKTHLVLEIEDDGLGFEPDSEINNGGQYGLIGIRERVDLLRGEFSMDSQSQEGTCLLIQIPLKTYGKYDV